jgi:DNA-binding SARP family transcriptional activator/class 3 adenylate cyclase/predicted ATPase
MALARVRFSHVVIKSIGINLLGGYAHSDGGHEALPRKSRALLAYLAMWRARGASRDQIADLLWDSSDPSKGRHSLRQCLTSLRRALGADRQDPITAVDRDVLAIRPSAVDVDVHRFETLARSAEIADLAAAAELYRGSFLEGFDPGAERFEAWAQGERTRLENVAAHVLRRLSSTLSAAGDLAGALEAAKRLAALDPLNEDDRQLVIRLLMSAGRRVEALREYESLKDSLRAELGVLPNEATRAVARSLRAENAAAKDDENAAAPKGPGAEAPLPENKTAGAPADPAPPGSDELSTPSLRPLAVLACEWMGTESLPADRQREVLAECCRRCGEWLASHAAHVARNASDGVVAYFGFSQTREQDVETCARAALALRTLAASLSEEFGTAIRLCAGVACGPVLVSEQPGAKGPEAIGNAVSLACQLRGLASPGEILIEPSARNLVRGLFDYGEIRSVDLKGFAQPVQVAPILGETETESRFEALRPGRLWPMVGREEEMDRLLLRWRQAIDGDGAVVLLVGEPGIGKSRLIQAFCDRLGDQAGVAIRLFCSPYGSASALHPFTAHLKRMAGVERADSEAERHAKLAAAIADAKLPANMAPSLAPLLSLSDEMRAAVAISPALSREKMLKALASLTEARATTNAGAALVILEDVHWADPTTVELLERFAEWAPQRRLLLILTSRPEYRPSWAGRAHTTTMTLGRLPAREAAKIVSHATGSPLPSILVQKIVAMAEGVPLFLEELSFAIVEKRAGSHDRTVADELAPDIPQSLQALLLARLDRLGPARPIAQIAAALGRTFNLRLLRAAATQPRDELENAVGRLVESEWVWRRGAASEGEYVFRHALLQDAAYHSLSPEARRALHERLATALEMHCPEIITAQPEILARHCVEAGLQEKAAALWSRAGQLSLARSALQEASAHFERALAILDSLPSTKPRRAEQLAAQVGLANALMHTRGYAAPETRAALDQAQRLYGRAEEMREPPEDPSILLAVLHGVWVASHVAFDGAAVRELSAAFMSLVEKQPTNFAHAVAHRIMGTSLLFLGDFSGGRSHLDRALALYDPDAHRPLAARFGQDVGVAVLSNRPLALWLLGYPDAAAEDAANAVAMARGVGQAGTLLYMLTRVAWIKLTIGDVEGADIMIRELAATAAEIEGSYWTAAASLLRGCHDALVGDAASAVKSISAGVAASRTHGARLLRLPWYLSCLGRAHARLGELGAARGCLAEAFDAVARTEEAWPLSDLHGLAGELALMSDQPDRPAAARHFELALSVACAQQAKSWELRASISLARLWRDQGESDEARDLLAPVYGWFTEGFDTLDLREAKALLDALA